MEKKQSGEWKRKRNENESTLFPEYKLISPQLDSKKLAVSFFKSLCLL